MKRLTRPPQRSLRPDADPLEEAWESARDARDIIRDKQRRDARELPDYTGDDEDTARHDMAPHPAMHVHVHQHSQPDTEPPQIELGPVKVRGLPKWLVVALGAVVAAATAVAAHFARK